MPGDASRALRQMFPTKNRRMRELLENVSRVAPTDASVLLVGESGTGKDQLAELIHAVGRGKDRPFVRIDCATLPDELFESELFGHEKGSFTGAWATKRGKLELAHRGTVYLDEIAILAGRAQPKLLRVLQEKEFTRVGGNRPLTVDARVVSSSSVPLMPLVDAGLFRRDLLYRVNVVTLEIPPLRERPDDISFLASRFLRESGRVLNKPIEGFSPEALDVLEQHRWPGNVRELKNVVHRATILETGSLITSRSLPDLLIPPPAEVLNRALEESWTLEKMEREMIKTVLLRTGSNFSKAATSLGINRKTLLEKRKKYGIEWETDEQR